MSELQSNRTYRNEAQGTNDVIDNTLDKIVSVYSGFTENQMKTILCYSRFQNIVTS